MVLVCVPVASEAVGRALGRPGECGSSSLLNVFHSYDPSLGLNCGTWRLYANVYKSS